MTMGADKRLACHVVGVEPAGSHDHALFRPDLPPLAGDANNLSLFTQQPFDRPFRQNNATALPDCNGQLRHDDIAIGQPCAARPAGQTIGQISKPMAEDSQKGRRAAAEVQIIPRILRGD
jgi:hypothetical protein